MPDVQDGEAQAQRGFQAGNAEGGAVEFPVFFVQRVRSMVGGNAIHRAIDQAGQQGFAVSAGAERRIHLEVGVVVAYVFIDQRKMVGRNFAAYAQAVTLGPAHSLEGRGRGNVGHMVAGLGFRYQADVAFHNGGLGFRGPAAQAQTKRRGSGVHGSARGHARVFRVLDHRDVQFAGAQQRRAHHAVVQDGPAIISQGNGAGALEGGEVGELLAFAARSGGGDRKDIHVRSPRRVLQPAGDLGGIVDRSGVGHGADGSEAAGCSCQGPAGDGLFVRLSRLAQVDVEVNKSGGHDQPARVKVFVSLAAKLARRGNFGHTAVSEQKVVFAFELLRGVDNISAAD